MLNFSNRIFAQGLKDWPSNPVTRLIPWKPAPTKSPDFNAFFHSTRNTMATTMIMMGTISVLPSPEKALPNFDKAFTILPIFYLLYTHTCKIFSSSRIFPLRSEAPNISLPITKCVAPASLTAFRFPAFIFPSTTMS